MNTSYLPLAEAAFADALKKAGMYTRRCRRTGGGGTHGRAVKAFAAAPGSARVADDLVDARWATPVPPNPGCCWPTSWTRQSPAQTIALVVSGRRGHRHRAATTDAIDAIPPAACRWRTRSTR